ncbi:MAG: helix-turn-helix transcriptional regulator [Cyanobacteria bacterium J06628_3]
MDDKVRRKELGDFLKTRRARIKPAEVGLPDGIRRRTPGLRREEVAQLASVGLTWYTWLEQGRDIQVSAQVLESIARSLKLTIDERKHLFYLANQKLPDSPAHIQEIVSPALVQLVNSLGICPALIIGSRMDILAWNRAACATFHDYSRMIPKERNRVWIMFTDLSLRRTLIDWEGHAQRALAQFRAACDRNAGNPWFIELVEDLQRVSPEFRRWWSRHDVQGRPAGRKEYEHPDVGRLVIHHTMLQVVDNPNLKIVTYTPIPETNTAERIQKLLDKYHNNSSFL